MKFSDIWEVQKQQLKARQAWDVLSVAVMLI